MKDKTVLTTQKNIGKWLKQNSKGHPKDLAQITLTVTQLNILLKRALQGFAK